MDCTGYTIAPAGQSAHRMEVQFKIGVAEGGTWDPTNDPSYQAAAGPNRGVPLYEAGARIWGNEPGVADPGQTTSPAPTASPTAGPTPDADRVADCRSDADSDADRRRVGLPDHLLDE